MNLLALAEGTPSAERWFPTPVPQGTLFAQRPRAAPAALHPNTEVWSGATGPRRSESVVFKLHGTRPWRVLLPPASARHSSPKT